MNNTHAFAELRQWLQQPPTANLWWQCVELVESFESVERSLLREYLLSHVAKDKHWKHTQVPCGEWDKDFSGWKLCKNTTQRIDSLPEATEVYCPPQTFRLGGDIRDEKCYKNEFPCRTITLTKGLWVLSTPVTQAMFQIVCKNSISSAVGGTLPVHFVFWNEAVVFCNQLSTKAGLLPCYQLEGWKEWKDNPEEAPLPVVQWDREANGYRLPTEVEWEAFAKAGCQRSLYGPLEEIAWYGENSASEKHPVGQKEPNAWGLYDTLGNIAEWCFDEAFVCYKDLPSVDPALANEEELERVVRGGSFLHHEYDLRLSCRDGLYEGFARDYVGFRVVRNG